MPAKKINHTDQPHSHCLMRSSDEQTIIFLRPVETAGRESGICFYSFFAVKI